MAIIKQYHKDTDTTYFYESTSYWDPEKGQSRSVRKCIGKLDPATGKMVPTGKRGRKKKTPDDAAAGNELSEMAGLYERSRKEAAALELKAAELEKQLQDMARQNQKLETLIAKIHTLTGSNSQ